LRIHHPAGQAAALYQGAMDRAGDTRPGGGTACNHPVQRRSMPGRRANLSRPDEDHCSAAQGDRDMNDTAD
jgi:hypothetical protein